MGLEGRGREPQSCTSPSGSCLLGRGRRASVLIMGIAFPVPTMYLTNPPREFLSSKGGRGVGGGEALLPNYHQPTAKMPKPALLSFPFSALPIPLHHASPYHGKEEKENLDALIRPCRSVLSLPLRPDVSQTKTDRPCLSPTHAPFSPLSPTRQPSYAMLQGREMKKKGGAGRK